jgi:hypothetical protein
VHKPALKKGIRSKPADGTFDDGHGKAAGADGDAAGSSAPVGEGVDEVVDEEDGDEVEHNERCSTCRRLDGSSQNPIVFCDG